MDKTPLFSSKKYLDGQVLLIDKPLKWTSFDVVKKIRYYILKKHNLKKIKVGHAGTLDPLATGLLIVCTGKLTKKISAFQKQKKTYFGTITLGGTTPSFDLETKINNHYNTSHITKKLIHKTTKQFIGELNQTPPIFSAIKKDGERLYKKARRGENVKLETRKIFVYQFNIVSIEKLNINFEIQCSSGTYIRSIANDFGIALNSGGYLSKLCRTAIGEHKISSCININKFDVF